MWRNTHGMIHAGFVSTKIQKRKKKNQDLPNGSQKNHSDIKKEYGGTRKKRELKIWGL
jgi:hypothetical protein